MGRIAEAFPRPAEQFLRLLPAAPRFLEKLGDLLGIKVGQAFEPCLDFPALFGPLMHGLAGGGDLPFTHRLALYALGMGEGQLLLRVGKQIGNPRRRGAHFLAAPTADLALLPEDAAGLIGHRPRLPQRQIVHSVRHGIILSVVQPSRQSNHTYKQKVKARVLPWTRKGRVAPLTPFY